MQHKRSESSRNQRQKTKADWGKEPPGKQVRISCQKGIRTRNRTEPNRTNANVNFCCLFPDAEQDEKIEMGWLLRLEFLRDILKPEFKTRPEAATKSLAFLGGPHISHLSTCITNANCKATGTGRATSYDNHVIISFVIRLASLNESESELPGYAQCLAYWKIQLEARNNVTTTSGTTKPNKQF